jgi:hypothetical protein
MPNNLNQSIRQLRQANLRLRQELERVEAFMPEINHQIAQLARLELVPHRFWLGAIVFHGGYGPESVSQHEGLVLQAALSSMAGCGLLCWSSEDFAEFQYRPNADVGSLAGKFAPYEQLAPALRALLSPHVQALIVQFCDEIVSQI